MPTGKLIEGSPKPSHSGARDQQTARAGEFYVAAELCRRGAYAVILTGNMPGVDLLASDVNGESVLQIQVKTKRKGDWHTSKRLLARLEQDHQAIGSEARFWVFVELSEDVSASPRFWVVPEADVVKIGRKGIAAWKQRNPNSLSDHCAIRERNLCAWAGCWRSLPILP